MKNLVPVPWWEQVGTLDTDVSQQHPLARQTSALIPGQPQSTRLLAGSQIPFLADKKKKQLRTIRLKLVPKLCK